MRLEKIKVNGFGKISEKEIGFEKNLNIIFGANESGKSTIQAFINAMLYGLGKSRTAGTSEKEKYKPWNSTVYGGSLEYVLDNTRRFSVWRDFSSNQTKVHDSEYKDISNEFDKSKTGGVLFAQEHLGVNGALFENTCFVSQLKIRLDSEGESLLTDRITNIIETGNENISYIQAVKTLEKAMVEEVGTERTSERPINRIREKIKRLGKERAACAKILENTRALEEELVALKKLESGLKIETFTAEAFYKDKKAKQQTTNLERSDRRIEELKINLAQREEELRNIAGDIPTGTAVFDDDVASQLGDLQVLVKKLDTRFRGLLGGGMGIFVYTLGSCLIVKELTAVSLILGAISIMTILIGTGLYYKPIKKVKSEIGDILLAGSVKTVSDYFDKKKETIFLLEKKKILEESVNLMRGQIQAVLGENILTENGVELSEKHSAINEHEFSKEIFNKLSIMNLNELELFFREKIEQLREMELRIHGIETEIKMLSSQTVKLPEIEEQLEGARQEELRLEEFAQCLIRTKEILDESNQQLKNNMNPGLSNKLSNIAYGLTGKYSNIMADAGGQGIKVVLEDGNAISPELLSGGTIDQIYFALRVAGLNMLSENGETLPLILDEPFSQYDDVRIKRTAEMLNNISEKNQVIIFTCRQNEVDLLMQEVSNAKVIKV